MLTSEQARTVAYVGDGYVVCVDCAVRSGALSPSGETFGMMAHHRNGETLEPICLYVADEWADSNATDYDGEYCGFLTCDDCGGTIAATHTDGDSEWRSEPFPTCRCNA